MIQVWCVNDCGAVLEDPGQEGWSVPCCYCGERTELGFEDHADEFDKRIRIYWDNVYRDESWV
jgi:hypothetical protein